MPDTMDPHRIKRQTLDPMDAVNKFNNRHAASYSALRARSIILISKQTIDPFETGRLSRRSRIHGVPPKKILSWIIQKLAFVELNRLQLYLATVLGFVLRKRWIECLRPLQVFYRPRHKHYFLGFSALVLHEHTKIAFNQPSNASVQAATTGHI